MYKMMLGLVAGLTLLSGAAMADGSKGKAASCCDAARPWTGFYVGLGAGAGVGRDRAVAAGCASFDGIGSEGVFGTVVVGYDRHADVAHRRRHLRRL